MSSPGFTLLTEENGRSNERGDYFGNEQIDQRTLNTEMSLRIESVIHFMSGVNRFRLFCLFCWFILSSLHSSIQSATLGAIGRLWNDIYPDFA